MVNCEKRIRRAEHTTPMIAAKKKKNKDKTSTKYKTHTNKKWEKKTHVKGRKSITYKKKRDRRGSVAL